MEGGMELTTIGAKLTFVAGLAVCGGSVIGFGCLDAVPSGATFIVMSIVIRSVEACGSAAFTTASLAILANEFPNNVATVYTSHTIALNPLYKMDWYGYTIEINIVMTVKQFDVCSTGRRFPLAVYFQWRGFSGCWRSGFAAASTADSLPMQISLKEKGDPSGHS
ncbi:hypothetical protein LSAT2_027398 [Lamellibrachia satsuma]|nr:hypothetical protein LSAT2_027398 [Lamellibrachia satsuma]